MADPLLLGIDIGTTNIKTILFDPTGATVAQASVRTPTHYPRPNWAYFDPEETWNAVIHGLRTVTAQVDAERIVGLAVASYGETAVPLDAHGQPLYEAIAWFDGRTTAQAAWLEEALGQAAIFAVTGSAVQSIFSLCKLRWLRDHEPAILAQTRLWLNMADYIAYRLCGVPAADFSLASRTLCLNLHQRQWATDLITAAGIDPAILAPLQASGTRLGPVLPAVAQMTGLPTHAQVAVGGHDHVLGALALGVTQVGDMLNSIGTAEAIFLPVDQPVADPNFGLQGYSQGVHAAGQYYLLGGLYTSGASVDWFRENCGGAADYTTLIAEAEQVAAGSLGAFFLPHLRLANSPHVDPLSRGAFIGLHTDMKRSTLFRALLEGLSYEVRYSLEPLLDYMQLAQLGKVYVAGGGAYNQLYTCIKASILNHPLTVVSAKESTALGAAILGGVGAGVYPNLPTALTQLRFEQTTIAPVATDAAFYEAAFQAVYQHLYAALRPLHQARL
ncbi:MAG: hypothetical protein KF832_08705 [Caldilineaceae bacterium]|nr:hypothetical protein [Caldilineaceae bacterium]